MSKLEEFVAHFEPLYGKADARWLTLVHLGRILLECGRPINIVETGSMRRPNNYAGDGNMTTVWDWIARETNGTCMSIDIDPSASQCTHDLCPSVSTCTGDSVIALRSLELPPIDLLFLDSYDIVQGNILNAQMHQLAELSSIWEKLPIGCLIASDDCMEGTRGKSGLTKYLLNSLGKIWITGYISVWQKVEIGEI